MNLKKLVSIELALLLLIPVIYLLSWRSFILSTVLSVISIVVVFILYHKFQDILIYFLGTVLGSIGEIACVYFGVWEYSQAHFLGIPLWLSLFWGYVFLVIRRLSLKVLTNKNVKKSIHKSGTRNYIILFITYILLIFIPSLLFNHNLAVFLGLFILSAVSLYKADKTDVFFVLTFVILGLLLELLCVHIGIWRYPNPDIAGIPGWLIFLYSGFSLFIKRTSETISEHLRNR